MQTAVKSNNEKPQARARLLWRLAGNPASGTGLVAPPGRFLVSTGSLFRSGGIIFVKLLRTRLKMTENPRLGPKRGLRATRGAPLRGRTAPRQALAPLPNRPSRAVPDALKKGAARAGAPIGSASGWKSDNPLGISFHCGNPSISCPQPAGLREAGRRATGLPERLAVPGFRRQVLPAPRTDPICLESTPRCLPSDSVPGHLVGPKCGSQATRDVPIRKGRLCRRDRAPTPCLASSAVPSREVSAT
jgi:hypothetical protein